MPCTRCYQDYISCGNETIIVAGTLAADTAYKWVLTTATGAKYSADVTTDANGNFTITVADLPNGLLNPYAGEFTLEILDNTAYQCGPALWNDSAYCDAYSCISFDVRNGEHVKNSLGCPCPE